MLTVTIFILTIGLSSLLYPSLYNNNAIDGNYWLLLILLISLSFHSIILEIFNVKTTFVSYFKFNMGIILIFTSTFVLALITHAILSDSPSSDPINIIDITVGSFTSLGLISFLIYLKNKFGSLYPIKD